jgi:hypothetical protein
MEIGVQKKNVVSRILHALTVNVLIRKYHGHEQVMMMMTIKYRIEYYCIYFSVQRKTWQTPWQPVPSPPIQNSCPWGENCVEVSCTTANDCSDNLICNNGRCSSPGQPLNMNPIIYTKVGPQTVTNTNPITNTNTDSLPDTNTNPLANTNMDSNTLPDINTNVNKQTNPQSGAAPSQPTNVGGDGGNGVIVINVYGGNGGRGGFAASKIPK